jgi:hypothetical protein
VSGSADEVGLAEQHAFLARSLADLDAELEAGDLDARDYATLKSRYRARATAVDSGVPKPRRRESRRRGRSTAMVAGVAGFAVLAGLLVAQGAGRRVNGSALSGSIPQTGPAAQLQTAQTDLVNGKNLDADK